MYNCSLSSAHIDAKLFNAFQALTLTLKNPTRLILHPGSVLAPVIDVGPGDDPSDEKPPALI